MAHLCDTDKVQVWTVARCPAKATLNLELEMRGKGFNVWTPRYPEKIGRRKNAEAIEVPLMPGFVFCDDADFDRLDELLYLSAFKTRFAWFTFCGQLVKISAFELDELRLIELDLCDGGPKPPRLKKTSIGATVGIRAGPFTGLQGKVVDVQQRHIKVAIDGFADRFRFSPFLLCESMQGEDPPSNLTNIVASRS